MGCVRATSRIRTLQYSAICEEGILPQRAAFGTREEGFFPTTWQAQ
jgi:hypothetical protein